MASLAIQPIPSILYGIYHNYIAIYLLSLEFPIVQYVEEAASGKGKQLQEEEKGSKLYSVIFDGSTIETGVKCWMLLCFGSCFICDSLFQLQTHLLLVLWLQVVDCLQLVVRASPTQPEVCHKCV